MLSSLAVLSKEYIGMEDIIPNLNFWAGMGNSAFSAL